MLGRFVGRSCSFPKKVVNLRSTSILSSSTIVRLAGHINAYNMSSSGVEITPAPAATGNKSEHIQLENFVGPDGHTSSVHNEREAMGIAKQGGWEVDALIDSMEIELANADYKRTWLDINFKSPKQFTFLLVTFASMGGLLSGLDQSLISGANLFLPADLGLDADQASLVNSSMPLGAVLGALLLSPANEYLGRRWSIVSV